MQEELTIIWIDLECKPNKSTYLLNYIFSLGLLNEQDNDNPDQALSAFDANSKGTVMGDGGALLLLESLETA